MFLDTLTLGYSSVRTRFSFSQNILKNRCAHKIIRFAMLVLGFIFLAIIAASQAGIVQKEHSLMPPYEAGADRLITWDLTGSAEYDGGHIRLTPDEGNKQGAIWNNYPSFSNNWEIQVMFRIHGKGVHLNGDGMAIWYVNEADILHGGPVFGSKDYFTGLGVFIDTFSNHEEPSKHRHPFISAMVNNGSIHYEHSEDGTMTQIGGCYAPIRNLDYPTRIAVSYINEDLSIYIDNDGIGQWKICFKAVGVHLPTGYHFGISASTSDVTDNHDVLAVTGLNMDSEDAVWEDKGDVIPNVENFEVPQKYHKDFVEKESKKVEKKREVKEEKRQVKEEVVKTEEKSDKESETEIDDQKTSLIRKLVYITGAAALILIAISTYRKWNERRRLRMEKLF